MDARDDLGGFLDKWRRRWPEWRVAEAFLPGPSRGAWSAWLALRQEFADAAWAGADPRPGEAKLGWWAEELAGWTRGARRHPLGRVLQPVEAPWLPLAATLHGLPDTRQRAVDFAQMRAQLDAAADAMAAVSLVLAGGAGDRAATAAAIGAGLCAQRLLDGDAAAVPLQVTAALGADAGELRLRAEAAQTLLQGWPGPAGLPRAERIQRALLQARLRPVAQGRGGTGPLPAWRALALAWRAARHSVAQA